MLDVSVGESKIAALIVPVGRQVPPPRRRVPARRQNAKGRIDDLALVHIQKREQPGRARVVDLGFVLETRLPPRR